MTVSEARDSLWSDLHDLKDGEIGSPEAVMKSVEALIRAVLAESREDSEKTL